MQKQTWLICLPGSGTQILIPTLPAPGSLKQPLTSPATRSELRWTWTWLQTQNRQNGKQTWSSNESKTCMKLVCSLWRYALRPWRMRSTFQNHFWEAVKWDQARGEKTTSGVTLEAIHTEKHRYSRSTFWTEKYICHRYTTTGTWRAQVRAGVWLWVTLKM